MICYLVYIKGCGKEVYNVETGELIHVLNQIPVGDGYYFLLVQKRGKVFAWYKVKPLRLMNLSPELKKLIGKE